MLRLLTRRFARLYNPVKSHPRSYEKLRLKSQFYTNPTIKGQITEAIQSAKHQIPLQPISQTLGKTGREIRATEDVKSFRTSGEPELEGKIRKAVVSRTVTEVGEQHRQYMQENLFILDQSLESRKNVMLAHELEAYESALIANKEKERRKALQEKDQKFILGHRFTKHTNVDHLLSLLSASAVIGQPVDTSSSELIAASQASDLEPAQNSQLVETTGEAISHTGVIDLTGRTTGRLSFTHLTHRELANYICFNLSRREEALQLFIGARQSNQFDGNLRASLIQKIALLPAKSDIISDKRFKDLIGDLSRSVPALTNKNVADTFWAICRIYSRESRLTPLVEHLIQSLGDQVCARISTLNSLNLAYVCDGLWRLKLHLPTIAENVIIRLNELLQLTDTMMGSYEQKPIEPWNYTVTKEPSVFHGFVDRTLPRFPVTAKALEMISRYLVTYPYFENKGEKLAILTKCVETIGRGLVNEVDVQTAVSLFRTFGSDSQLALHPPIQTFLRSLTETLQPHLFDLVLRDANTVLQSALNAGLYNLVDFYKELELNARTFLHNATGADVVETVKVWARFYYAFSHGIDPVIDPAYILLPKKTITGEVVNEYLQQISKLSLTDMEQLEVAKVFASLGHRLDFHPSFPGIPRLAQTRDYHPTLFFLQSLHNSTGFAESVIELIPEVMSTEPVHTQVAVLLALAHVGAKVEIDGICTAVKGELQQFQSNRDAVTMLWALVALGKPDAETVQKLAEKVNFQRLTRLETMLCYQVYLSYTDVLKPFVPDSLLESGPQYFRELNIWEKTDLPEGRSAEGGKRLSGYFVQFYDSAASAYFEKYRRECRLADGGLIGILRVREEQLKQAGFGRLETVV